MAIDYRSFNSGKTQVDSVSPEKRWWTLSNKEMPEAIEAVVRSLAEYDGKRQNQFQISARLYGNVSLMGINGLTFSKTAATSNTLKDRISYNVIQSAIDTVTSKIAKNRPRPLFLTSGGDYKMQRKAKKLDKFVDGIFYENKAYDLGVSAFRDGCVFGDGIVHVFNEHGRVKFERVLASELYVDQMEAFYGHPRQLHRVKNIDRAVLTDLFPEKRSIINGADSAATDLSGTNRLVADQVTVCESWHLPSGPDAGDGRHVLSTGGELLLVEDWKKARFPFAFFKWCPRLYGFWAQGLSEQIQNIQLEINKLLWVIQRSMHLAGTFKILAERGAKIVDSHYTNDFGVVLSYTGTPPQYIVPPIVPPEIYSHLQTLKNQAFEQAGISMLSAAAKKPEGLNSGKALREFNDIESDRFMTIGHAYENFFLDLASLAIEEVKDIHESGEKYEVKIPGKKFLDSIDWKEIELEDDEYVMKAFPVSSLPNDPSGRLQTVQEYMQAGLLTPRSGRKLLDFPDLEQVETLANAEEEYIGKILDKIVDDGEYTAPEAAFDDLKLGREMALEQIALGKLSGLEEEKLQMLRDFISDIDSIEEQQKIASAPQPGMAGSPQALPAAPPTSDMLPNAPGLKAVG